MPALFVEFEVFQHFQEVHRGVAKDTERTYNDINQFNLFEFRLKTYF